MLSNAYFLAKFRFDTAENEPAKNLQKFANVPNFANLVRSWTGVGQSSPRCATVIGPAELQLAWLSRSTPDVFPTRL